MTGSAVASYDASFVTAFGLVPYTDALIKLSIVGSV